MSRSKHRRQQSIDVSNCPHERDPEACHDCARTWLYDAVFRLDAAVSASRSSSARDVFVTGGSSNWEPIDVGAMALVQDIDRIGLDAAPRGLLLEWRDRARVILRDAFAPVPLVAERRNDAGHLAPQPRPCPKPGCSGHLLQERDPDPRSLTYGKRILVRCSSASRHAWPYRNGGFLRLRVDLQTAAERVAKTTAEPASA